MRQVSVFSLFVLLLMGASCSGGPNTPGDGATNGWRQFSPGLGYSRPCTPGEVIGTGCYLPPAIECRGNPEMRVCEMDSTRTVADCAEGRLRILGEFRNERFGHCPAGTITCPATGEYLVIIRAITAGQPFACPNEAN